MPSTITSRLDGLTTSVAVKAPCRVATTANITLSGTQTIDGVAVVADDRVLVRAQTDATENGIWKVASGTWSRATDFAGSFDVVEGTVVFVHAGSLYSGTFWRVTTDDEIVIGTSSIAFTSVAITDLAASTGAGSVGFSHSASYSAGTVGKKLQHVINPMDAPYNATGDGTADDYTAFSTADVAAAAAGLPLVITETHRLNTSYTPTADLVFLGGKVKPASGTTFTVTKGLLAACTQIFDISLSGTINLNNAKIVTGYAEWFGVVADDAGSAATNTTRLNAAIVATPEISLTAADYYVDGTIKVLTPNHALIGKGSLYDSTYGVNATRLLVTDGSSHTLQIGPDSNPGAIAQFPQGIKVKGIQVARTVAPVISSACCAVRLQYLLEAYTEDVRGDESMNGIEFNGTVSTRVYNCSAKRTSAGTGAGTDSWKGFYINGNSGIAAGGNASLYIAYCHADDTRSVKTNGNGFYADNDFTDLFLDHCETVSCTVGMNIQGNSSTGADTGNTDLHIINPINDAFATYGILIQNMGKTGSADITSPYFGPASGATAALKVLDSPGAVNVTGGQFVMSAASGCVPISIENSSGVSTRGTMILECGTTALVMASANNCRIDVTVKNQASTGGAGIQLSGTCKGNIVAPTIMGQASGTSLGIQVLGTAITFTGALSGATSGTLTSNFTGATGTYYTVFSDGSAREASFTNASTSVTWSGAVTATADANYIAHVRNEFNCSGIDSATIAGGSANKLTFHGVQITSTGLNGTNLISGVMT